MRPVSTAMASSFLKAAGAIGRVTTSERLEASRRERRVLAGSAEPRGGWSRPDGNRRGHWSRPRGGDRLPQKVPTPGRSQKLAENAEHVGASTLHGAYSGRQGGDLDGCHLGVIPRPACRSCRVRRCGRQRDFRSSACSLAAELGAELSTCHPRHDLLEDRSVRGSSGAGPEHRVTECHGTR